ncbi:unnamed protein product [Adineta steineri]|uniref:Tetratricopeptide repeat protein n=1 Tax=Adineta steineri TaxID=433720 RepID=A0A819P1M9_9BILA|nr:unnamed protein product [Adineta steineri]CAF4005699.1 unnamed protein product [Adineta steineri]
MPTDLTKETAPATQKQDDCFAVGDWLYVECKYEKAREHFQNILKRPCLSASDSIRCYKSLGAVEVELKKYDEALDMFNTLLTILMKCDLPTRKEDIMTCYVSIGKVYWLKGDYVQAIEYHHEALDVGSLTLNPTGMSTIYKNLANIYTNTKEFNLSRENFQRALEIDRQRLRKDHLQFGQTYANMGKMYQEEGNYKEALAYFEKAREIWLKTLAPTHVYIEKIEKTICKMKSKLVQTNAIAHTPAVTHNAVENQGHIEPLRNIQQSMNQLDVPDPNKVMIIWLEEFIDRDEDCGQLKNELRQITNSLKMVDSVESCRKCLQYVKDRKLFFIIQGKYAKQIVPEIVQIIPPSMKPVVYIFSFNVIHFIEWAAEQECIMEGGIFDHEKDLLLRLAKDLNDYVKQKSAEYENVQSELIPEILAKLKQIFDHRYQTKDAVTPSHQTDNDANQAKTIMAQ